MAGVQPHKTADAQIHGNKGPYIVGYCDKDQLVEDLLTNLDLDASVDPTSTRVAAVHRQGCL